MRRVKEEKSAYEAVYACYTWKLSSSVTTWYNGTRWQVNLKVAQVKCTIIKAIGWVKYSKSQPNKSEISFDEPWGLFYYGYMYI